LDKNETGREFGQFFWRKELAYPFYTKLIQKSIFIKSSEVHKEKNRLGSRLKLYMYGRLHRIVNEYCVKDMN